MLEPLEWDDEEGPTKETFLPRAARRSRPSAGGLRVIRSSPSLGGLEDAPLTERELAPATVTSPRYAGGADDPRSAPFIEILEAEEVTIPADGLLDPDGVTLSILREGSLRSLPVPGSSYDSDAPASAIRPVALPAVPSAPLPLLAPFLVPAADAAASGPRSAALSSHPPAPFGPSPSLSLDATLLTQEVVRLRRGLLVSLVVASAALTLSLILALVLLLQLTSSPTGPDPDRVAPAARGPQRI